MNKYIYTYGVFDLLHPGHVRFLKKCKGLIQNSYLIVGVVSDKEVKENKDPRKPILSQNERMEILSHINTVDRVMLQATYDPVPNLIILKNEGIKIEMVAKGDDKFQIHGEKYLNDNGGKFVFPKYENEFSTSDIIKKIIENFT
jgi:D-beta-D-heptose 7-phosphate kinase / D-beta-D-heptose 1-phosphate adenosyltransferase